MYCKKPKDVTVFLSNIHEFVAIKKYKAAVAAMNTIQHLESYAHLKTHIKNMSLFLVKGGVYVAHTVFLNNCKLKSKYNLRKSITKIKNFW